MVAVVLAVLANAMLTTLLAGAICLSWIVFAALKIEQPGVLFVHLLLRRPNVVFNGNAE